MSKHTPGPWTLEPEPEKYFWQVFGDLKFVASIPTGGNKNSQEQLERKLADAKLIAAAPDLLAALEMVMDCDSIDIDKAREMARAAIARARGEA